MIKMPNRSASLQYNANSLSLDYGIGRFQNKDRVKSNAFLQERFKGFILINLHRKCQEKVQKKEKKVSQKSRYFKIWSARVVKDKKCPEAIDRIVTRQPITDFSFFYRIKYTCSIERKSLIQLNQQTLKSDCKMNKNKIKMFSLKEKEKVEKLDELEERIKTLTIKTLFFALSDITNKAMSSAFFLIQENQNKL